MAQYLTLASLRPILEQGSQNLFHNLRSGGILPLHPYRPRFYFNPFEVMEKICLDIIQFPGDGHYVNGFDFAYDYVGGLPDRLSLIDPRLLHQIRWIEMNSNCTRPMSMATLPPLASFECTGVSEKVQR